MPGPYKVEVGLTEEAKAELEEMRRSLLSLDGVIKMTVDRLEGLVEGRPTHELNFLQRIDELREIERAYLKLKAEGKA